MHVTQEHSETRHHEPHEFRIDNNLEQIVNAIAGLYVICTYVDLSSHRALILQANDFLAQLTAKHEDFSEVLAFLTTSALPQDRQRAAEFMNIDTLRERLRETAWITNDFYDPVMGVWNRIIWIAADRDSDGVPVRVIYGCSLVNDEKHREEQLLQAMNTDGLTGANSRRAYENQFNALMQRDLPPDLVILGADMNGLKQINDNRGHMAGDAMLRKAAECLKAAIGECGQVYRVGGDEFVAIFHADEHKLAEISNEIERICIQVADGLSLSCGSAAVWEWPQATIRDLVRIADERMYAAKERHYLELGINRGSQQAAINEICMTYLWIVEAELNSDTYQVIQRHRGIQHAPQTDFSEWLQSFAHQGEVCASDRSHYLSETGLEHLRAWYTDGSDSFSLICARSDGRHVLLEIIRVRESKPSEKRVFVYVKELN